MQILLKTFLELSPLYFFLLFGVALRGAGVVTDALTQPLSRLVFEAFLPISLFVIIYEAQLDLSGSADAMAFALACVALLFLTLIILVPRVIHTRARAATVVQSLFRSNFAVLGLAYVILLYGRENVGETSILIAMIVPLFNILAVIDFALLNGAKPEPRAILKKIAKNPLIIATLLALTLKITNLQLPDILYTPLETLSDITTPFAMIVVGTSLTLQGFRTNRKTVATVTILRLLVIPGLIIPFAVLCGFREVSLIAFLAIFAGPSAVASCAMSYQLGGDGELAGQIVAATTVFSLLTMYLFIVVLQALGFC